MAKTIDFDPSIDMDRLDDEWVQQPKLYFKWASRKADANREVDIQKRAYDLTVAEVAAAIRDDPAAYDLGKVTEGSINALVPQQREVKDAWEGYIKAKHHADILGAVVAAIEQRRRALENLVALHGREYFSSPRVLEGAHEAAEELNKKAVRGRMRQRPRQDEVEDDDDDAA